MILAFIFFKIFSLQCCTIFWFAIAHGFHVSLFSRSEVSSIKWILILVPKGLGSELSCICGMLIQLLK